MGHGDLDFPDFLPGEKPQFFRFRADPHFRLLRQLQTVDHDHHPPDASVPEGGDPPRIVVNRQLPEPFPGNPQPQLLISLPDDGLKPGLALFAPAADETPDVGIPPLFQQQPEIYGVEKRVKTEYNRDI